MLLWSAKPADGMENTLVAEGSGDQTTLTLTVQKPGGSWTGSVLLKATLSSVQKGMTGGDWKEQYRHDQHGFFTAFRVWHLKDIGLVLCWAIEHRNRGTTAAPNYQINDQIHVLDLDTLK